MVEERVYQCNDIDHFKAATILYYMNEEVLIKRMNIERRIHASEIGDGAKYIGIQKKKMRTSIKKL